MIYRMCITKTGKEYTLNWIKKSSTNGVLMTKVYDLNNYGFTELYKRKDSNFKIGNYVRYTYLFDDEFDGVQKGYYTTLKKFYREHLIDKLIYDI